MAETLGSARVRIAAIDHALGQASDAHETSAAALVEQANADTLAAIDQAVAALVDLRMLVDIVPDNRPLVNGHVYAVHGALAEACLARARFIAAADALAASPVGVH